MPVNAVKGMIRKFEETRSLDVAPGRGPRATESAIVEEVGIATAEASLSHLRVNGHSIARAQHIPRAHDFTQKSEALLL